MPWLYCLLVPLFTALVQSAQVTTDLGSSTFPWRVTNGNGTVQCAATVPGMIHTDLLAASLIPEPFFGNNDDTLRWIPADTWTYSVDFPSPSTALSAPLVDLVFDGLATVAEVTLNGVAVLSTDNQFRVWTAAVRTLLAPSGSNNTLVVAIASSIAYMEGADKAYNMSTHNITSCPQPSEKGYCYRNFIRQNPASFSWDWGPAFAPVGIYKSVYLLAHEGPVLKGVTASAAPLVPEPLTPGGAAVPWSVNVTLWLEAPAAEQGTAMVEIAELGLHASLPVALGVGLQAVQLTLHVPAAQPWWPVNFAASGGLPKLYGATASYQGGGGTSEVAQRTLRLGLRTVALIQDPLPGPNGASFYFRINGVKTYLKGSNWVPIDAFESRVTLANLTAHFDAFAAASFNALRHWGGAVYQRDEFFDLADERGILVFFEFSFANANYPVDPPFLRTVGAEVRDQALRLQAHPCLLLWSANNEIPRGLSRMLENGVIAPALLPLYTADYVALMFDTILGNLSGVDAVGLFAGGGGVRPTLSSSPSQGNNTRNWPVPFEPGGQSGTGNLSGLLDGFWRGDFHGYLYSIDCFNTSEYPRTRFTTEFGLQSWPSLETMVALGGVTPAQAANYSDPFWAGRNHHGGGQAQLAFFIQQHYPLPPTRDTRAWLYMTQVSQGYCIRQQAEHYRRLMSECEGGDARGGGCNAGTLYWQAVDSWPAPTWASIEYGGRRKLLHYYAARFFAPLLVSLFLEGGMEGGGVGVVNEDNFTPVRGAVRAVVVSFARGPVATLPLWNFSLPPASSARIGNFTLAQVVAAAAAAAGAEGACPTPSHCFLTYQAVELQPGPPPPLPPPTSPAGPDFLLLGSVPQGALQDPHLEVLSVSSAAVGNSSSSRNGALRVEWNGSAPALFVWFESPLRGTFGDNGFAFVPGLVVGGGEGVGGGALPSPPAVIWTPAGDGEIPSAEEFRSGLRLWSLFDVDSGVDLTQKWPVGGTRKYS